MILKLDFHNQFAQFLLRACLITLLLLISINILIPKGFEVLAINGIHTPVHDSIFTTLTHFGNALIFIPLIIVSLFIEFRIALIAALTGIIHGVMIFITKKILFPHVARPIALIDNDLLYFIPEVDVHARYSFPSGHTATIFAVVIFVCLLIRKKNLSILLLCFALLVGISRIYLLQHFLQDVVGGAFIGMGSALISVLILNPNKKWPNWMSRRINIPTLNPGQSHRTTSLNLLKR